MGHTSRTFLEHVVLPICKPDIPIDPPAEMVQYSNRPSNTGQSSPTLTVACMLSGVTQMHMHTTSVPAWRLGSRIPWSDNLTFRLFSTKIIHIVRCNSCKKINIFVCMELCHFFASCWFSALRHQKGDNQQAEGRINASRWLNSRISPSAYKDRS